jgi:hypothetical protein
MYTGRNLTAIAGLLSAALAGCDRTTDDQTSQNPTQDVGRFVSLQLVGSPSPMITGAKHRTPQFLAAAVTVREVHLESSRGEVRIELKGEPATLNLIGGGGEQPEHVAGTWLSSPSYDSVRFVIAGGYVEVAGEGIYATKDYDAVPAGGKVVGQLELETDDGGITVAIPVDALTRVTSKLPAAPGAGAEPDRAAPHGLPPAEAQKPAGHRWLWARFDVAESFVMDPARNDQWVLRPVIEVARIEDTARISLHARLPANQGTVSSAPILEIEDRQGNIEAAATAALSDDGAGYVAVAPNLFVTEGPFRVRLFSSTGAPVATDPTLPSALALGPDAAHEIEVNLPGKVATATSR